MVASLAVAVLWARGFTLEPLPLGDEWVGVAADGAAVSASGLAYQDGAVTHRVLLAPGHRLAVDQAGNLVDVGRHRESGRISLQWVGRPKTHWLVGPGVFLFDEGSFASVANETPGVVRCEFTAGGEVSVITFECEVLLDENALLLSAGPSSLVGGFIPKGGNRFVPIEVTAGGLKLLMSVEPDSHCVVFSKQGGVYLGALTSGRAGAIQSVLVPRPGMEIIEWKPVIWKGAKPAKLALNHDHLASIWGFKPRGMVGESTLGVLQWRGRSDSELMVRQSVLIWTNGKAAPLRSLTPGMDAETEISDTVGGSFRNRQVVRLSDADGAQIGYGLLKWEP